MYTHRNILISTEKRRERERARERAREKETESTYVLMYTHRNILISTEKKGKKKKTWRGREKETEGSAGVEKGWR